MYADCMYTEESLKGIVYIGCRGKYTAIFLAYENLT